MAEYQEMRRRLLVHQSELMELLRSESSRFDFVGHGAPPERYEVTFRCKGLVGFAGDHPQFSDVHRAEIILHPDYPVSENSVEIHWLTDILHPNIDNQHGPCVRGTPLGTEITLAQICEFLAEMIQYQRYNVENYWKSVSSKLAVQWVLANPASVPLDRTPLRDRIPAQKGSETR